MWIKNRTKSFFILALIIGLILIFFGSSIIILRGPIDDYTRHASNTITLEIPTNMGSLTLVADVFCNLTSTGGFFCSEPIDVSAIVIHDLSSEWNLTNLVFLESRNADTEFFEINENSGVFAPYGGRISLRYSHYFFQGTEKKYVYEGTGQIYYDYEGEFSTTLQFKNQEQVRYDYSDHVFTTPTIVIRPHADFQQIIDSKTNLGLAWIVVGLTILTLVATVASFTPNIQTRQNQSEVLSKDSSSAVEANIQLSTLEKKMLLLEYKQLHNEILQRNQYGWLIISIFVTASFLVSFGIDSSETLSLRYGISLGLVGFSCFLHHYFDFINESCWHRRDVIQTQIPGLEGPSERYKKLRKTMTYQIGKLIWKAFWFFLIILFFHLLVFQFYVVA